MRAEAAPNSSHEELRQEPRPASAATPGPSFDFGDERVALRLPDGCGEIWACSENGDPPSISTTGTRLTLGLQQVGVLAEPPPCQGPRPTFETAATFCCALHAPIAAAHEVTIHETASSETSH